MISSIRYGGFLLLCLTLCLASAQAGTWSIDNSASRLSFISTKAGAMAEVHGFDQLSGTLRGDGQFELTIDLNSVNTAIDIRDERMRDLLFDTARFPTASLEAQIDMAQVQQIAVGQQGQVATEARLNLHGREVDLTIQAEVARLDEGTLLVTSSQPIVVTAGQFDLLPGVDRLREIAGLSSISPAVPISFRLTLVQSSAD